MGGTKGFSGRSIASKTQRSATSAALTSHYERSVDRFGMYGKGKKRPYGNTFDLFIGCVFLTLLIGITAWILELIAIVKDNEWNMILMDGAPFPRPSRENLTIFHNKVIKFDGASAELNSVRVLIQRNGSSEYFALGFILMFVVIVLLAVLLYVQGEGSRALIIWIHVVGAFFMIISGILIISSDLEIDNNHKRAADELVKFYNEAFVGEGSRRFPLDMPLETVEVLREQVVHLEEIQKLCALSDSKQGRYSGSFGSHTTFLNSNFRRSQKVTLDDLRELGFCSREDLKFASFILCIIYGVLCGCITGYGCYLDSRNGKAAASEGGVTDDETIGDGTQPPPSEYGYGNKSGKPRSREVELFEANLERYDPRYPPIEPEIVQRLGQGLQEPLEQQRKSKVKHSESRSSRKVAPAAEASTMEYEDCSLL